MASRGETVLMEDPVYPGLRNVFQRGGARVIGIPVGEDGIEMEALERALEKERARLLVLTPNFQNPTGTTMPEDSQRGQILDAGAARGRDGGRERFIWRAAVSRARRSVDETSWTVGRDDSAGEFFEDRVSGVAGGMGDRAAGHLSRG